jgi:hypothetical protein
VNATKAASVAKTTPISEPDSSDPKDTGFRPSLTPEHRADLHASGITDEALAEAGVYSGSKGFLLPWWDGVESFDLPVFDREKRPMDRKGKAIHNLFPSKGDAERSPIGPNVVRMPDNPVGVLVLEGIRQQLAGLSYAPPGWGVVGINGVRGVHEGNVGRCSWAKGLPVVLLPDADYRDPEKPGVKAGADATARHLLSAGATEVRLASARGVGKEGLDDVLARTVPEKRAELLAGLIEKAERIGGAATDDAPLFVSGTEFLAAAMVRTPALWGTRDGDVTLGAKGESLMLVGPPGVGKSTMAHLVVFGRLGLLGDAVGWPVTPDGGRVLYLAMDRPQQIARAMYRLVRPEHREVLGDRLVVREGAVPGVDLVEQREWLLDRAREVGATTVVVDSIKDVLPDPSDERRAGLYNQARQLCLAAGIEWIELHHNRKANGANKEPNTLDDVYGSRWLTAGAGSVISLYGQPGDVVVSMSQLKSSAGDFFPRAVLLEKETGQMRPYEELTLDLVLGRVGESGISARRMAEKLYGTSKPSPSQVESTRAKLKRMVRAGLAEEFAAKVDGGQMFRAAGGVGPNPNAGAETPNAEAPPSVEALGITPTPASNASANASNVSTSTQVAPPTRGPMPPMGIQRAGGL